jgi:hypothetical protein
MSRPVPGNLGDTIALVEMDDNLDKLLAITERVLMHLDSHIPPETVATEELRALLNEMKTEIQNAQAGQAGSLDEKSPQEN